MNKEQLAGRLKEEIQLMKAILDTMENEVFFRKSGAKWSIGENVQHLVLSAKPLNLALSLPKMIMKVTFGKPYRPSYPYEEIVKRYKQLLTDGAVATGAYVPKAVPLKGDKTTLVERFSKTHDTLLDKVQQWSEADLDNYFLPHPLLGKLTVREMLYFTAYHISHHRHAIEVADSAVNDTGANSKT